jgi:hypothetical protein
LGYEPIIVVGRSVSTTFLGMATSSLTMLGRRAAT